ncbi:hypothetical protein D9757_007147 [Collybiopsis confluens]|uniref:Annexin n=1 Tax=Collybiopsis confluens TaxID=2823264 RepID=A0A8H5HCG6_9AGAR|nr:hypothetical protein D9757_007147 [Collybiopsis confluens]
MSDYHYYSNPNYGAPPPPPNGYGYGPPGGYVPPNGQPPPIPASSYPGPPLQNYGPPPPSHAGYSPSYMPPPQGHQYAPPPPPAFSSYPVAGYQPPPAAYPNQPQQSQAPIIYYMNVPVPSPAYHLPPQGDIAPGYEPTMDVDKIRKATKGFGTDEAALISVFGHLGSLPMAALAAAFKARVGKDLEDVLKSETGGYFGETLRALVLGPLWYDVDLVHSAIKGAGTDELLLTEIIADRTPSDRQNLFIAYRMRYGRDLQADIRGDLSAKTERMYTMMLSANPPPDHAPLDYKQIESDVKALYKAGQGKIGTDEIAFCDIIINRSRTYLAALCDAYARKYKSLTKVIKSEFSGHMRQTLLFIVEGAKPKHAVEGPGIWRDAKMLEKSMKGLGTKDKQLVRRIVRYHWDRNRFEAITAAYHKKYKKSLESRVAGETSGDYKKLLVELVRGA